MSVYRQDNYSVFIVGETIDLCVPSLIAIERDGWADWFNNSETTAVLDHGIFPVTREEQIKFYESLKDRKDRIVLLICTKQNRAIGVISLSSINLMKRSAEIAIVLPPRGERAPSGGLAPLRGLEAMALMTKHGFENLGLNRIGAGQTFPSLRGFNNKLVLLGYRTEGVFRCAFVKGHKVADVVRIACLHETYQSLKLQRKGQYWLGNEKMHALIKQLPKQSYADIVGDVLQRAEVNYFSSVRFV